MATALFAIPHILLSLEMSPGEESYLFYTKREADSFIYIDLYVNPKGSLVNATEVHLSYHKDEVEFKREDGFLPHSYPLPYSFEGDALIISHVDFEPFAEAKKIRTLAFQKKQEKMSTSNFTILPSSLLLLADGEATNIFK